MKIHSVFIAFLFCAVSISVVFWTLSRSSELLTAQEISLTFQNLSVSRLELVMAGTKNLTKTKSTFDILNFTEETEGVQSDTCPDILSRMSKGKWVARPLNEQEQITIDTYLRNERVGYRMPSTYQRNDGRCGDVTYEKAPLYKHMWFKAICNPKGVTPCCHTNKCVALTEEECRCPTCYDERQAIHAEFAQWKPTDDRCGVNNFTKEEACRVLDGATIYFVGDSFIRHVFAALVIILTNQIDGALKKSIPTNLRDRCKGMNQITGATCRDYLDQDRLLCDGKVKVTYTQIFPANDFPLTQPILRTLRNVPKSIIVLGLGIHNNYNSRTVARDFLLPFLNLNQILSSNLTAGLDVDLATVLTNFGDLRDNSTAAVKNDSGMYMISGNAASSTPRPHYEYLIKRAEILNITGIDVNKFRTPFVPFKSGVQNNGLHFDGAVNINIDMSDHPQAQPHSDIKNSENNLNAILRSGITQNTRDTYDEKKQQVIPEMSWPQKLMELFSRRNKVQEPSSDNEPVNVLLFPEKSQPNLNFNETSSPVIFETFPKLGLDIHVWPRLLWIGAQAPGLLKSPKFYEQTAEGVQNFNNGIREICKQWRVPYLETFSFTNGTVSFDGTHYGWGINMLKVNMFLTYIQKGLLEEHSGNDH